LREKAVARTMRMSVASVLSHALKRAISPSFESRERPTGFTRVSVIETVT
jgi:hypothetical protein